MWVVGCGDVVWNLWCEMLVCGRGCGVRCWNVWEGLWCEVWYVGEMLVCGWGGWDRYLLPHIHLFLFSPSLPSHRWKYWPLTSNQSEEGQREF